MASNLGRHSAAVGGLGLITGVICAQVQMMALITTIFAPSCCGC